MIAGPMVSLTLATAFRTPGQSQYNVCLRSHPELTLSSPLGLVTITELASLVLTWNDQLADYLKLYSRQTNQWKLQREQWRGANQSR